MKKILILSGLVLSFALAATVIADTMTVVSDTSVSVYGPLDHYAAIDSSDWGTPVSAVVTWKHPSWPTITGATWISSAYYTEEPRPDSWRLFSDVIELPSCAINIAGLVSVTSDNAEEAYLNGTMIGSDGEVEGIAIDNQEWNSVLTYPLTGLQAGTNALKIIVRNYAQSGGTAQSNPAGLTYKVDVTYDINPDCDEDGVLDVNDKCLGTTADDPLVALGTNRWIWDESSWITGKIPGKGKGPQKSFTMEDTYGCSCTQILDSMKKTTGSNFGGHYKYGCSKSIIEDWIAGEYYVGPTFVETVEVPANSAAGVSSVATLETGKDYFLKAYGTGMACNQPGCVITFDVEYSTSDGGTWVDGVATPYNAYGPDLLDLKVDGNFVDWGEYNATHNYTIPYSGTGNLLSLVIYDLAGSYFNDTGSLYVDIIEDKWVDLW